MLEKKEIKLPILLSFLFMGLMLFNIQAPRGLELESWHLLVTFVITILGIISSAAPISVIALISITVLVLTKTLTTNQALSGFSSSIVWLVVFAFFIARAFIKTELGKKIAYNLISRFGSSTIGLGYSLIFTEFLLSPMIPSTSARGGGIIYPIAKSLADEYESIGNSKISAFIILLCFHTNVICCALFLTSMAGNPLMVKLAENFDIKITWVIWAKAAVVPGLINLLLLPHIIIKLLKLDTFDNSIIIKKAKDALISQGKLTNNQIIMILVFISMLFMWIFGKSINIDTTTTALLGFVTLLIFQIINWNDVLSEKPAWDILIWFAILLMLSDSLSLMGVDNWLEENIRVFTSKLNYLSATAVLGLFYFYSHYFFASVTARVTVMYATFLLIIIDIGLAGLPVAIALAIMSNLSAGLTHYGINSAPIYFSSGYFSTLRWMKLGFIIASLNILIWSISGYIWWKIIRLI